MCPLGIHCRGEGVSRTREDEEERISLRVHLDAPSSREGVADDSPVAREKVAVVVPQPFQELRRVLDVREDERDGACGQLGHESIVVGVLVKMTEGDAPLPRRGRRGG
jgi:hypothetical protein